jgi:hypothetical protein
MLMPLAIVFAMAIGAAISGQGAGHRAHLYVLCGAGQQVRLNVAGAVCWHNNSNIDMTS